MRPGVSVIGDSFSCPAHLCHRDIGFVADDIAIFGKQQHRVSTYEAFNRTLASADSVVSSSPPLWVPSKEPTRSAAVSRSEAEQPRQPRRSWFGQWTYRRSPRLASLLFCSASRAATTEPSDFLPLPDIRSHAGAVSGKYTREHEGRS